VKEKPKSDRRKPKKSEVSL